MITPSTTLRSLAEAKDGGVSGFVPRVQAPNHWVLEVLELVGIVTAIHRFGGSKCGFGLLHRKVECPNYQPSGTCDLGHSNFSRCLGEVYVDLVLGPFVRKG